VITRLTLLLSLSCASLPAQDSDAILKRVDDHYNHLASLETHYSEHYTGMGMDRNESGTLTLKKPGRMRWSYATPVGKVFLLDGKNGWFYTPGDSQAQRVSAKPLDDLRSPLRLLLGHTQLKKELDSVAVKPASGGYEISGIPKGMSQRVKLLKLGINSAGLIVSMNLEEIDGASTVFTFSGMRENIPVKDSDFVFKAPAGVAIVDGLPPI
jgi:outer membrane lipoprotein carrier protein